MVTARKPRTHTKSAVAGRTGARRTAAKAPETIRRKIDKIIKRRAPALRMLD